MRDPATREADPGDWCAVLAVFFLALVWHRLGIPTKIYFDEIHYVPAARKMLALTQHNPEHPLLGKELIAAAIRALGDKPLYWRVPSALLGAFGLFAFSRALWWASLRRWATIAGTLLLATDFAWFIQSRIAMLDMAMASFGMVMLWMAASAVRRPRQARWRLALCGIAMGLAIAAKWSIVPAAMTLGLGFFVIRLAAAGRRFVTATKAAPIPGISLAEAALWLGIVPMLVYWATFAPAFFYHANGIDPLAPIAWHRYMLQLQDSVVKAHPYRSVWYQWMGNWRAIWYLYEVVDGAQRGIVLIGNPFTMIAGL
ncbi:MAG: phospholipid carrier-dependent glycosyltransferase, partial [Novosphingobium sp.]|nr:phospholipid carrier-dependent glycosyltransferase [Novosphingobium sp.]